MSQQACVCVGFEGFVVLHASTDTGARSTDTGVRPSQLGGGGGTHVPFSESNPQTERRQSMVPHPPVASTTHGVVA